MAAHGEEKTKSVFERNKFFATTNISGFGWIQSSNSRLETGLWYAVIIIFTALTVRNVFNLTMEYKNQVPIATVALKKWNGDISNMIFSIPIAFPEFIYEEFDCKSIDGRPFRRRSLENDLTKALHMLDTKEKLLEAPDWPYVFMTLMTRFTTHIYKLESTLNKHYSEEEMVNMEKLGLYIKRMVDYYKRLNVSNSQLIEQWFKHAIKMICRADIDRTPIDKLHDVFRLIRINFISSNNTGPTQYLLTIAFKRKHLLHSNQEFYIRYNSFPQIIQNDGIPSKNETLDDTHIRYLNHNLLPEVYVSFYQNYLQYENLFVGSFEESIAIEVKAVYSYQSIGQSCSKTTSQWACYEQCMNRFIMETCHCASLFSDIDSPKRNVVQCSLEMYEQCRPETETTKKLNYCLNSCPERCLQEILSFEKTKRQGMLNYELYLFFSPKFTKFPAFKEIYPQTRTGFWAALGGTIDFWIGMSVISAVHLTVHVIKQIFYTFKANTQYRQKISKNKRMTKKTESTRTIANIEIDEKSVDKKCNDQNRVTLLEERFGLLEAAMLKLEHQLWEEVNDMRETYINNIDMPLTANSTGVFHL